jgi:transcriptional regulator with XRE-family HTH domain
MKYMQPEELRRIIAERVRHRRKELGLTQAALAAEMGVTQPYIAEIESGRSGLHSDRIAILATILRTTPSWLISAEPVFS